MIQIEEQYEKAPICPFCSAEIKKLYVLKTGYVLVFT